MPDTEMQDERQQTGDVHPGTRVSLEPSASTILLNYARPASSIYSRSMNVYQDGRSIVAATEEKGPNRLDGLIHPAMRRTAQSISSLNSITAMLRRLSSHDDLQRQQQEQQQTSASVEDSAGETCVGSELPRYPRDNIDTERHGPAQASTALSKPRKRRCSLPTLAYAFVSVAILVILVMCVCIALDVFQPGDGPGTTEISEQASDSSVRSPVSARFSSPRLVNDTSSADRDAIITPDDRQPLPGHFFQRFQQHRERRRCRVYCEAR